VNWYAAAMLYGGGLDIACLSFVDAAMHAAPAAYAINNPLRLPAALPRCFSSLFLPRLLLPCLMSRSPTARTRYWRFAALALLPPSYASVRCRTPGIATFTSASRAPLLTLTLCQARGSMFAPACAGMPFNHLAQRTAVCLATLDAAHLPRLTYGARAPRRPRPCSLNTLRAHFNIYSRM